ncbi:hypothetical protein [uncultured Dokdonia sp.]|uniref:hypothetical protein n=1 Tax=uncultured Dokdonia sp. TaxID=575653 RepID=UPI002625BBDE|nr:hypothetical protein [uncultured Dokdonia sp.]
MPKFENVAYTKPFELIFLGVSTITIFFGMFILLNKTIGFHLLHFLLVLGIAIAYFIILKKRYIIKVTDFTLTPKKLTWNQKQIDFSNLKSYKIHWMKGAGITFKLKNGKTVRISANQNFCDSGKFIMLCRHIDSELSKHKNNHIIRKKSFFETKLGYYYAVIITVLVVVGVIYKMLTKNEFNYIGVVLLIICLATIWSGVRWKRK